MQPHSVGDVFDVENALASSSSSAGNTVKTTVASTVNTPKSVRKTAIKSTPRSVKRLPHTPKLVQNLASSIVLMTPPSAPPFTTLLLQAILQFLQISCDVFIKSHKFSCISEEILAAPIPETVDPNVLLLQGHDAQIDKILRLFQFSVKSWSVQALEHAYLLQALKVLKIVRVIEPKSTLLCVEGLCRITKFHPKVIKEKYFDCLMLVSAINDQAFTMKTAQLYYSWIKLFYDNKDMQALVKSFLEFLIWMDKNNIMNVDIVSLYFKAVEMTLFSFETPPKQKDLEAVCCQVISSLSRYAYDEVNVTDVNDLMAVASISSTSSSITSLLRRLLGKLCLVFSQTSYSFADLDKVSNSQIIFLILEEIFRRFVSSYSSILVNNVFSMIKGFFCLESEASLTNFLRAHLSILHVFHDLPLRLQDLLIDSVSKPVTNIFCIGFRILWHHLFRRSLAGLHAPALNLFSQLSLDKKQPFSDNHYAMTSLHLFSKLFQRLGWIALAKTILEFLISQNSYRNSQSILDDYFLQIYYLGCKELSLQAPDSISLNYYLFRSSVGYSSDNDIAKILDFVTKEYKNLEMASTHQLLFLAKFCYLKAKYFSASASFSVYLTLGGFSLLEGLRKDAAISFEHTSLSNMRVYEWEIYGLYLDYLVFLAELFARFGNPVVSSYYIEQGVNALKNVPDSSYFQEAMHLENLLLNKSSEVTQANNFITSSDHSFSLFIKKLVLEDQWPTKEVLPVFHQRLLGFVDFIVAGKKLDYELIDYIDHSATAELKHGLPGASSIFVSIIKKYYSRSSPYVLKAMVFNYLSNVSDVSETIQLVDSTASLTFERDHHLSSIDSGRVMQSVGEFLQSFIFNKESIYCPDRFNFIEKLSAELGNDKIVSLVADDHGTSLFVSVVSNRRKVIHRLSFNRLDKESTFSHLLSEFNEIMANNSLLTSTSYFSSSSNESNIDPNVVDKRASWWSRREDLDKQLGHLLWKIEFFWLGIIRYYILSRPEILEIERDYVKAKLVKQFARAGQVDPHLIDLIIFVAKDVGKMSALEVELLVKDWISLVKLEISVNEAAKFVLKMSSGLRQLIEDDNPFLISSSSASTLDKLEDHIFLVLGKEFMGLPIESLPCCLGRSMSRVPSMYFLWNSLINLPRFQEISAAQPMCFLVNPSEDLVNTEKLFHPQFKALEDDGFASGYIGTKPPSNFLDEITMRGTSLYLYFGHGTGEQYLHVAKRRKQKHFKGFPSAFLMGCSSGALKYQGRFEAFGLPWEYLLAASPCIVANLWDVTDKDIDRFSQSCLQASSIFEPQNGLEESVNVLPAAMNLGLSVAKSRSACLLKYIVGAAPVVYGVPMKFCKIHT